MGVDAVPTVVQKEAVHRARRLCRAMADDERRLWAESRQFRGWYGINVRKQVPIDSFVVDFAVHEHRLVIEVDGEHHFTADGLRRDGAWDAWLEGRGSRRLRFNAGELGGSFGGCVEEILRALGANEPPPLTPPLKGEGDIGRMA